MSAGYKWFRSGSEEFFAPSQAEADAAARELQQLRGDRLWKDMYAGPSGSVLLPLPNGQRRRGKRIVDVRFRKVESEDV